LKFGASARGQFATTIVRVGFAVSASGGGSLLLLLPLLLPLVL